MPTKKVRDWPFCTDSDHHPSKFGLEPGFYEHTCPKCGKVEKFTVNPPIMPMPVWPTPWGDGWPTVPPWRPYDGGVTTPVWPPGIQPPYILCGVFT